jgi:hypothetical protein
MGGTQCGTVKIKKQLSEESKILQVRSDGARRHIELIKVR